MNIPLSSLDAPQVLSEDLDTQLDTIARLSRRGSAENNEGAWLARELIGPIFDGAASAKDALHVFLLVLGALGWIEWRESSNGKILHGAKLRHEKRVVRQEQKLTEAEQAHD